MHKMKHTRHAAICDKYYLTKRTKAGNKRQFYPQLSEKLRQRKLYCPQSQLNWHNTMLARLSITWPGLQQLLCVCSVCDLLFPLRVSSYIVGHWHREARSSCSVAACLNLGARAWSSGASSIIGDVSGDVGCEEPYTVTSISGFLTPVRPYS